MRQAAAAMVAAPTWTVMTSIGAGSGADYVFAAAPVGSAFVGRSVVDEAGRGRGGCWYIVDSYRAGRIGATGLEFAAAPIPASSAM